MNRHIIHTYQASPTLDGEGVALKRLTFFNGVIDPFLMIDELKADSNETLKGFPPHPHRGIQTLTYLIHGGMWHKDSLGNQGHITAGQMQWMDSGQGIVHAEQPHSDKNGLWGYQFWLNLSHAQKFVPPRYLDIDQESYQYH